MEIIGHLSWVIDIFFNWEKTNKYTDKKVSLAKSNEIQKNSFSVYFVKKSVKQKKTIKEKKWGDQKSKTKKEWAKKKNKKNKKLSKIFKRKKKNRAKKQQHIARKLHWFAPENVERTRKTSSDQDLVSDKTQGM